MNWMQSRRGRDWFLPLPGWPVDDVSYRGDAMDPVQILKKAVFHENYQQMVLVKDIEVYSLCEHH